MAGRGGYSASLVADYMIAKSGAAMNAIQVIKTAYIAHGYSLALLGKPLIREKAQAWRYGPLFPSMYFALRDNGQDPIRSLDYCGTASGSAELAGRMEFFKGRIDEQRRAILDDAVEVYGALPGGRLISITHAKGTPWEKHYKPGVFHNIIPDEETRRYYEKRLKDCAAAPDPGEP